MHGSFVGLSCPQMQLSVEMETFLHFDIELWNFPNCKEKRKDVFLILILETSARCPFLRHSSVRTKQFKLTEGGGPGGMHLASHPGTSVQEALALAIVSTASRLPCSRIELKI